MNKDCLKKYGAIERPEIIIKGATEAWLNAKKQLDNEKERSIKNERVVIQAYAWNQNRAFMLSVKTIIGVFISYLQWDDNRISIDTHTG